jgi:acyl dehydratase
MCDPAVVMSDAALTDELVASMRAKIGRELRLEDSTNNEDVTRLAVLRFALGIGDTNPLWTDPGYAAGTRWGELIAPPAFVYCCCSGLQFGWPGLGAFHSASTVEFRRPLRLGDKVTASAVYEGFDGPSPSRFAGRKVTDHVVLDYADQHGALVARSRNDIVHYERGSGRERAAQRQITLPHPWTEAEIADIESSILAECPRGGQNRWWQDVTIGDSLDGVTKGPLGLTDEVAFVASGAAPIPRLAAHRASLRQYAAQPAWSFRDPHTFAREPIYAVHYNDQAAHAMGAAMSYDVGVQRHCWQTQLLTDWIGDEGWLKWSTMQLRGFVYLSDVIKLGGKVTDKRVDDDGEHIVEVVTWARNQRGDDVMPGRARVALPSRDSNAFPLDSRLARF